MRGRRQTSWTEMWSGMEWGGQLEGGCTGVQYRRSVVKEPRMSPQRLTDVLSRDLATTPQRPYFGHGPRPTIHALRRDHSYFAIRDSRFGDVHSRSGGYMRGAPIERPLTQRRSRGVFPN